MENNIVRFILVTSSCLVLTYAAVTLDTTHCERICAGTTTIHDESEVAHCGCNRHSHKHSNHTNHHTTAPPTTLLPKPVQYEKTTLAMCDYLCSIQLGGAACDCSAPIVPGRKRSKLLKTLSK